MQQSEKSFDFSLQKIQSLNTQTQLPKQFFQVTNFWNKNPAQTNFTWSSKSNILNSQQMFSSEINLENIKELEAIVQRWEQRKKNIQDKYNEFQQI